MNLVLIATVLIVMAMAYQVGLSRSRAVASGGVRLHSRPGYYGVLVALWCGLPALLLFGVWLLLQDAIVEVLVVQPLPAALAAWSDR